RLVREKEPSADGGGNVQLQGQRVKTGQALPGGRNKGPAVADLARRAPDVVRGGEGEDSLHAVRLRLPGRPAHPEKGGRRGQEHYRRRRPAPHAARHAFHRRSYLYRGRHPTRSSQVVIEVTRYLAHRPSHYIMVRLEI